MSSDTAVVILAAGAGSRWSGEGHKLSATLPATATEPPATVIERALAHAISAALGPVIVITGAAPDIVPTVLTVSNHQVTVSHNPRWAEGQMTSLRAGLDAATELDCCAVVVGLADQPFITPAAWRTVAACDAPIAVATYDGRRGNPVRLDSAVWTLLPANGDEGARSLMRVRPDLVREVPCSGSPADIDTEEDLRRWQNS
ncbi:MAG TPA: nucleotidyltransferase family protein [Ilumatobacteraceae bacterium]|nr:nucleotidyltransferase family protein [Ilumatobacteraceae bacterium]